MSAASARIRRIEQAEFARRHAREVGVPSTQAGRLELLAELARSGKLSRADLDQAKALFPGEDLTKGPDVA